MKKQAVAALLCVFVALTIVVFQIFNGSQSMGFGPSSKVKLTEAEKIFISDFQKLLKELKDQKNFPDAFGSLQYVKYNFHSPAALKFYGQNPLPILTRPSGQYFLELDFIPMPDSPNDLFILQLGLVEIRSNNKIWESSENFKIPKGKN